MKTSSVKKADKYNDHVEVGQIMVGRVPYIVLQPPKAVAEREGVIWNADYANVKGAQSFSDGYANTVAMAKAGSEIAKMALDLGMHIPAMDEVDMQFRTFRPGTGECSNWYRSGINLNSIPPRPPYSVEPVKQTKLKAFKKGGAEAFAEDWYWSSTQHPAYSSYAYAQYFGYGGQSLYGKDDKIRVRFVRRIKV